eukprot:3220707-Rhodomonas_salina.2
MLPNAYVPQYMCTPPQILMPMCLWFHAVLMFPVGLCSYYAVSGPDVPSVLLGRSTSRQAQDRVGA